MTATARFMRAISYTVTAPRQDTRKFQNPARAVVHVGSRDASEREVEGFVDSAGLGVGWGGLAEDAGGPVKVPTCRRFRWARVQAVSARVSTMRFKELACRPKPAPLQWTTAQQLAAQPRNIITTCAPASP